MSVLKTFVRVLFTLGSVGLLVVCCVCSVALVVSDSVTPWTIARRASLSVGFSRQEYWSGLPCPPPGEPPDPGIKPTPLMSPALQADIMRGKLH